MAHRLSFPLLFLVLLLLHTALPVVSLEADEANSLRKEVLKELTAWTRQTPAGKEIYSVNSEEPKTAAVTQWTECVQGDCSPKISTLASIQFNRISKGMSMTSADLPQALKIPKTQAFRHLRLVIGLSITYLRLEGIGPALAKYKGTGGLEKFLFKGLHHLTGPLPVDVLFNLPFYALRLAHHDFENSTAVDNVNTASQIVPGLRCITRVVAASQKAEAISDELIMDTPLCLVGEGAMYVSFWPLIVTVSLVRQQVSAVFASIRKAFAQRERFKTVEMLREERAEGWRKILDGTVDRVLSDAFKAQVSDLFKPEISAVAYGASEGVENLFYSLFNFTGPAKADELVRGFKKDVDAVNLRACYEIRERAKVFGKMMEKQLRDSLNQSARAYNEQFLTSFRDLALADQRDNEAEWIPSDSELGKALIKAKLKRAPKPNFDVQNVDSTIEHLQEIPLEAEDDDLLKSLGSILASRSKQTLVDIVGEATGSLYQSDMRECANDMTDLFHQSLSESTPDRLELTDMYVDCADEAIYSDPHIVTKVANGRLRCGNDTTNWAWSDGHDNLSECQGRDGEKSCQSWPRNDVDNLARTVYQRVERSGVLDMREADGADAENPTGMTLTNCRGQDFSRNPNEQLRLRRGYIGCLTDDGIWFYSHSRLMHCQRGTIGCETFTPGNMSSSDRLRATEAGVIRNSPEAWSYMEAVDCNQRGAFKNKTLLQGIDDGKIACGTAHNKWFWIKNKLFHCAGKTCQSFTSGQIPDDVAILARKEGIMSTPPEAFTDCHQDFFLTKGLQEDVAKGKLGCGFETNYWVWNHGGLRYCAFHGDRPCAEYEAVQARESDWPMWKMPVTIQDCKAFSAAEAKSKEELMWDGKIACGDEAEFWMLNGDRIQKCRKGADNNFRHCAFFKLDAQELLQEASTAGLATNRPPGKHYPSPYAPRRFRYATQSHSIIDCNAIFITDKDAFEMWEGRLACGSKSEYWLWNGQKPMKCRKDPDSTTEPKCAVYDLGDDILNQAADVGLVRRRPASEPQFRFTNCKALPKSDRSKHFEAMWENKIRCGNRTDVWYWAGPDRISHCATTKDEGLSCDNADITDDNEEPTMATMQLLKGADENGLVPFPKPKNWQDIRPNETHDGAAAPDSSLRIEDCKKLPPAKRREDTAQMRQGTLACGHKGDYWRWSGTKTLEHCRKVRHREEVSCRYAEFGLGFSRQVKAMEKEAAESGLVMLPQSKADKASKPNKPSPDYEFNGNPGIEDSLNEQDKEAERGR
ncbi:hypothetical protein L249_3715 [Ophiocordyceps polyrhachis-furcata BCC 54312]|uniref:Uncharacterized protein n=1 Tax=Ophiocordyceps polyrhachis-furcata BCC 54312 TaxID=1330021 RepID=A0A367L4T9_9HYPO|nr:hypothetical protein L249_3715 [Ophiocordyceps polyrhachis-furcata BCC 54312]